MKFYKNRNYQICNNSKFYTVKRNFMANVNYSYTIKECAQNICSVIGDYFNSKFQVTFNKFKDYKFYKDICNIYGSSNY